MRDATSSRVAVAPFFPLWCGYGGRAGQSVTAARGTVGHPARQGERCPKEGVRADTFRTYRYCVDRSPRRISRKGICRDLIGDMLDSLPLLYFTLPLPSCTSTLGTTLRRPFIFPSSTTDNAEQQVTFCTTIQYAQQINGQCKRMEQCKQSSILITHYSVYFVCLRYRAKGRRAEGPAC